MPDEPVLSPAEPKPLTVPLISVKDAASVFDKLMEKDPHPAPVVETATVVEKKEEDVPVVGKKEQTATREEPPEDLGNEGRGEKWKKFRHQYKDVEKDLDAARAQLVDFDGTKKERDELKARVADMDAKISEFQKIDSISKLQSMPDFQRKYDKALEASLSKLTELAGYGEIDADTLKLALAKPMGKERMMALEDVLADAPSIIKGKIVAEIDRIDAIDAERASELTDAQTSITARLREQEATTRKTAEAQAQQADEAFKVTAAKLGKELGLPDEEIQKARDFFTKNDDMHAAADVILRAFAQRHNEPTISAKDKRIAEMEAELAQYRESSPGIRSGGHGDNPTVDKDLGFVDAILKGAQNLTIQRH